jgi:hypothetical protein
MELSGAIEMAQDALAGIQHYPEKKIGASSDAAD